MSGIFRDVATVYVLARMCAIKQMLHLCIKFIYYGNSCAIVQLCCWSKGVTDLIIVVLFRFLCLGFFIYRIRLAMKALIYVLHTFFKNTAIHNSSIVQNPKLKLIRGSLMKILIILLFVVLTSILISGCLQDGAEDASESISSEDLLSENATEVVQPRLGAMVRLEYYGVMKPSAVDINKGETVGWWSQKSQGSFVLVSEDGLFDDVELFYRHNFNYTFYETGTYKFSVKDMPQMNGTITVV